LGDARRQRSRKATLAAIVGDAEYVCEARRVARLVERTGTPVFEYSFDYEIDTVAPDRVIHGLEYNLLFGNNFGAPSNYVLTDPDRELFRAMAGYWSRFAARATPNVDDGCRIGRRSGTVRQGRGSDKHLVLVPCPRGHAPGEHACDLGNSWPHATGAVPAPRQARL
jgi:carboxylesterase type B